MKKPEIEPLLYEDEEGNVIGLDEVQLLEPVPTERIPKVRLLLDKESVSILSQLLKNQDSSVSHQAKESLDYYRRHRVDRAKPTKAIPNEVIN
jgi:hypothetical protein